MRNLHRLRSRGWGQFDARTFTKEQSSSKAKLHLGHVKPDTSATATTEGRKNRLGVLLLFQPPFRDKSVFYKKNWVLKGSEVSRESRDADLLIRFSPDISVTM